MALKDYSRLLRDATGDPTKDDSGQKISDWAKIALDGVENEEVHTFWSNVITEPVREEELQQLKEGASTNSRDVAKPSRYVVGDVVLCPIGV